MKKDEYRLTVGDHVLGMCFQPPRYVAQFQEYFNRESTRREPDIHLRFKIHRRRGASEIDDSFFTSKVLTKRGFRISSGIVQGRYDRYTRHGTIRVNNLLTIPPTTRVFEQLLYQAFYSARNPKTTRDCLIHSSGVLHNGSGYLFVGPPESGKSTIAALSHLDIIYNDEINVVYFVGTKVDIGSTPFNGLYQEKSEGRCELKAVFLLKQSVKHKLTRISGAPAVKAMMREIVPPIGLDEVITPAVRERMLDTATRLERSVPVYRLEFQRNSGFWEIIDRELANSRGVL